MPNGVVFFYFSIFMSISSSGFKIVFIFLMVSLAWLLFKLPNFNQAIYYLQAISSNFNYAANYIIIFLILLYSSPVIILHFLYLKRQKSPLFLMKWNYILYAILLFLIFTNSGTAGAFIYFQF